MALCCLVQWGSVLSSNSNNNEYLERLTCTGPKHLHVLYKYILSKFNAYSMNVHTHTHTQTRTRTHKHTHTPVTYQGNVGNETEEKVFKKRKVFKEDLKELTERNRGLVPDNWSLIRERALTLGLCSEGWYSVHQPELFKKYPHWKLYPKTDLPVSLGED